MTKRIEIEISGDEAYNKGDFSKAINKYETAFAFAQSKLHAAELAHKIAISYRGIYNYHKYLQYEIIASDLYPSKCSDQAADFLKVAGDFLYIIDEYKLSEQAFEKASFFFAKASDIEVDMDSVLSLHAWSAVCRAKIMENDSIEIWAEASKMFFEAAKNSEGILAKDRNSKAYECLAMSKIFKDSSIKGLKEANELLMKALDLNENNYRLNINLIAIQILIALADIKEDMDRFSEKKSIILKQLLELNRCIRSIGHFTENLALNLDLLTNQIRDEDLIDIKHLDVIWKAFIRLMHNFAL